MYYLGVDQSLTSTGLALVTESGRYVASETVSVGTKKGGERLHAIRCELLGFIDVHVPRPDVMGIQLAAREGFAVRATNKPFDLGMVAGVVEEVLWWKLRLPTLVVPPMSLKKFATGDATADKAKMLYTVKTRMGVDLADRDDEADAVLLAMFARATRFGHRFTTRAEAEAVHAVTTPKTRPRLRRTTHARNV